MRKTLVLMSLCAVALASCGGDPRDEGGGTPTPSSTIPAATFSPSSSRSPGPTVSPSPTPPTGPEWRRAVPFSAEAIAIGPEGDVYLTGFQEVGPAPREGPMLAMVLERSDPDGGRVWIRRWTSSNEWYVNTIGFDVEVSPDGDLVYVAGEIMDESGENRITRVWAYSRAGRPLWSRETSGMAFGAAAAASDTGVVVGGAGWVSAFDEDGTELWTRDFEEPPGDHCDEVADLAIGNGGAIYAVGALDRTPTCNETEGVDYRDADIVVQKRSSSGRVVWSRVFTDPGARDNDRAFAVGVADRSIFVTGHEDGRAWLAQLTPKGRTNWTDHWGRAGSAGFGADVSVSPWGPVYAIADRRPSEGAETLGLRRYATDGDLAWRWTGALPEGGYVAGLATAPDESVYVLTSGCTARCPLWRFPA